MKNASAATADGQHMSHDHAMLLLMARASPFRLSRAHCRHQPPRYSRADNMPVAARSCITSSFIDAARHAPSSPPAPPPHNDAAQR